MFSCAACLRHAIQCVAGDLPLSIIQPTTASFYLAAPPISSACSRLHSTWASIQKGHHRRDLRKSLSKPTSVETRRPRSKPSPVALRDAQAREQNRSRFVADPTSHESGRLPSRGTRIELEFLRDPLKLAQAVLDKLRSNNALGALEMVRASERVPGGMTGTSGNLVSWNHLIDWYAHNGDMVEAAKLYNEMKKRGHRPDAHTYTIILRGYADMAKRRPHIAVKEAVGVWNSIFAKNSDVTPNTIHTNAVVNVCARARDMDSMWQVLGRVPEKGPGCPDNTTYTTVLNALQADAISRASKVTADDGRQTTTQLEETGGAQRANVERIFAQAAEDGRKLWGDVLQKWRTGQIAMDEPLVCAMGRLLMLSMKEKDWRDVLSIMHKTMNITDLTKTLNKKQEFAASAQTGQSDLQTPISRLEPPTAMMTVPEATVGVGPNAVMMPRDDQRLTINGTVTSSYAVPSNNTLSLVIEVSSLIRSPSIGRAYWDLLTSATGPYKVSPDAQNLTAYLRLLRISRASRMVKDLVQADYASDVAEQFFKRGTFVIAMSTCVRDKNNPNVFEAASSILDAMQGKLTDGDMEPKVLAMYVELALATTGGVLNPREARERGRSQEKFVPDLRRNNIMRALRRLGPDVVNIRKLIKDKVGEGVEDRQAKLAEPGRKKIRNWVDTKGGDANAKLEDLVAVLRSLIGACDRIIAVSQREHAVAYRGNMQEDAWDDYVKDIVGQKKKLSSFLARMVNPTASPHYQHEVAQRAVPMPKTAENPDEVVGVAAEGQRARDEDDIPAQEKLEYDPEEAELDNEIYKSIVARKKVYRAMKEGKSAYEKTKPKQTLKAQRTQNAEKREQRRVQDVRSTFPPDRLKPMKQHKGPQERWADRQRERRQMEEGQRLGGVSGLVQRGWGAGFERVAARYGDGKRRAGGGGGDFVEL